MTAPLELAAFLAFIRGVDIPNTTEQARLVLVERALRAEATVTAMRHIVGRYLDQHCAEADREGLSALCECSLCTDARRVLHEELCRRTVVEQIREARTDRGYHNE
jgi:predicted Ser/Thr protein kinase